MKMRNYPALLLFSCILIPGTVQSAQAQQGAMLYETKCSRCHAAFAPSDYPADEWPGIVRSMRAQSALTAEEEQIISDYLVAESGQLEERSGGISYKPVLGGYLYTEYFETPAEKKNFDIHYLAMYASGWVSENIYYFSEFELEHGGTGGSNTFVEQAYLDYWVKPNIAIRIGAMLAPFNRFDEFHDPISNFIVTRPQVSRELGVSAWKDVGVNIHGYFNLNTEASLGFDLYTINGLGGGSNLRGSRQYRDNNEDMALGARVNLMYSDFIEVGGSLYQGKWDDAGLYNLQMLGVHGMVRTPFADLYGEYISSTSENEAPSDDGKMSGYFIQGTRLFEKQYRVTVRYGALDYLDPGDQFGRDTAKGDMDLNELALGFTYYPVPRAAFKFEYNIFGEGDRAAEKDNNQIGIQVAVKF